MVPLSMVVILPLRSSLLAVFDLPAEELDDDWMEFEDWNDLPEEGPRDVYDPEEVTVVLVVS